MSETIVFKTKDLCEKILSGCKDEAEAFHLRTGRKPTLAVILVGDDPASQVYVRKKGETCAKYGLEAQDFFLPANTSSEQLLSTLQKLNSNPHVHGILVQSPLPKHLNERFFQSQVLPSKDVDGFHPLNAGALFIDAAEVLGNGLPPCTPAGVMEILRECGVELRGKHAVVIGRSTIVGKPMAQMLLSRDATVTICHSRTVNIEELCRTADLLIAAVGRTKMVNQKFIKPGAVVIDVGINRETREGKSIVVGDVDTESVKGIASLVTPVPNGVGPMTIALLIRNTIRAANAQTKSKAN